MSYIAGKFIISALIVGSLGSACQNQAQTSPDGPTAHISDFQILGGENWEGELSYRDYASNTWVTIPTRASIDASSQRKLIVTVSYPEEPWEDTKETLTLSKDGRQIDRHTLISRKTGVLADFVKGEDLAETLITSTEPTLLLVTEYEGEDNNLPATLQMHYIVHPEILILAKDVRTENTDVFLNRNRYRFTR